MPTGLIRLSTTQKVLKTYSNKSIKQYCLGSNQVALELGDPICNSEVGPLQRELNGEQFLLNSCRTKHMSMAKIDIKVRIEMC